MSLVSLLSAMMPWPVYAQSTDAALETCRLDQTTIDPAQLHQINRFMENRSGVLRCEQSGKPTREFEYQQGRLLRNSEWSELGQRLDLRFHPNGAVKTRSRQVVYEGRPARDREEYWESGLLRLRGTYLEEGSAQGLVQTYHEAGPLAGEAWYESGQVVRRKAFDMSGKQILEEEYLSDGRIKSSMQRTP